MKLVVDLPRKVVGRIKELVEDSEYESAQEFLQVAVENQLEFEADSSSSVQTLDEAIASIDGDMELNTQQVSEVSVTDGSSASGFLNKQVYETVSTVNYPNESRLDDGPLWGQYNRIFPVKLVLRVLANELADAHTPSIDLDTFSSTAARLAREFGQKIEEYDTKYSRGRGEKLASGLPTGDDEQKSTGRFKTHFVGYSDRNGNLTGAPATLKFVEITDEEGSRIGITDAGLRFAELENPLLDGGPDAERALSDEERAFYINHVSEANQSEYRAMALVADAIATGDDQPKSLTNRIETLNDDWSEAQANTVRSGLVSRLFELGLIDRERVGQRRIRYTLTDEGREFHTQTEGIEQ